MTTVLSLLFGFLLDALFGDPPSLPHPVRLMGLVISRGEAWLRRGGCKTPESCFLCGMALTLFTVLLSFAAPYLLLLLCARAGVWLVVAAQSVLCCWMLAAKSLKTESMRVYEALAAGDLPGARKSLSWIVGRDTMRLDEAGVARAAVETVAENTSDGVAAPIFFMLLGGAPLGFAYKAVNTLDSMIGYKNDRYLYFGRFAARLDDVFNFIPARLCGLLMVPASAAAGLDFKGAARVFCRDRKKHRSPNSAHTEAACAGALGVRLGGGSFYGGRLVEKPALGDGTRPIEAEDIGRANRLMLITSVLFLLAGAAVRLLVLRLF